MENLILDTLLFIFYSQIVLRHLVGNSVHELQLAKEHSEIDKHFKAVISLDSVRIHFRILLNTTKKMDSLCLVQCTYGIMVYLSV